MPYKPKKSRALEKPGAAPGPTPDSLHPLPASARADYAAVKDQSHAAAKDQPAVETKTPLFHRAPHSAERPKLPGQTLGKFLAVDLSSSPSGSESFPSPEIKPAQASLATHASITSASTNSTDRGSPDRARRASLDIALPFDSDRPKDDEFPVQLAPPPPPHEGLLGPPCSQPSCTQSSPLDHTHAGELVDISDAENTRISKRTFTPCAKALATGTRRNSFTGVPARASPPLPPQIYDNPNKSPKPGRNQADDASSEPGGARAASLAPNHLGLLLPEFAVTTKETLLAKHIFTRNPDIATPQPDAPRPSAALLDQKQNKCTRIQKNSQTNMINDPDLANPTSTQETLPSTPPAIPAPEPLCPPSTDPPLSNSKSLTQAVAHDSENPFQSGSETTGPPGSPERRPPGASANPMPHLGSLISTVDGYAKHTQTNVQSDIPTLTHTAAGRHQDTMEPKQATLHALPSPLHANLTVQIADNAASASPACQTPPPKRHAQWLDSRSFSYTQIRKKTRYNLASDKTKYCLSGDRSKNRVQDDRNLNCGPDDLSKNPALADNGKGDLPSLCHRDNPGTQSYYSSDPDDLQDSTQCEFVSETDSPSDPPHTPEPHPPRKSSIWDTLSSWIRSFTRRSDAKWTALPESDCLVDLALTGWTAIGESATLVYASDPRYALDDRSLTSTSTWACKNNHFFILKLHQISEIAHAQLIDAPHTPEAPDPLQYSIKCTCITRSDNLLQAKWHELGARTKTLGNLNLSNASFVQNNLVIATHVRVDALSDGAFAALRLNGRFQSRIPANLAPDPQLSMINYASHALGATIVLHSLKATAPYIPKNVLSPQGLDAPWISSDQSCPPELDAGSPASDELIPKIIQNRQNWVVIALSQRADVALIRLTLAKKNKRMPQFITLEYIDDAQLLSKPLAQQSLILQLQPAWSKIELVDATMIDESTNHLEMAVPEKTATSRNPNAAGYFVHSATHIRISCIPYASVSAVQVFG